MMPLLLLLLPCAAADFDAVFLVPSDAFPVSVYRGILATFGEPTIVSVVPDTMTGAEARRLYFPDRDDIFRFQLLHVTRVRASVAAANSTDMAAALPPLCRRALGSMAVVAAAPAPARDLLDLIPPVVAPIAVGAWLLPVAACGACGGAAWCCRPAPKSADRCDPYAAPRSAPGPAAVRLAL
jgi:hypothetical protein